MHFMARINSYGRRLVRVAETAPDLLIEKDIVSDRSMQKLKSSDPVVDEAVIDGRDLV
jgi:pheromone shutdown protein TraB